MQNAESLGALYIYIYIYIEILQNREKCLHSKWKNIGYRELRKARTK